MGFLGWLLVCWMYDTFDCCCCARARAARMGIRWRQSAKTKKGTEEWKGQEPPLHKPQHIIVIIIMAIEGERPDNNKRKYSSYAACVCVCRDDASLLLLEPSKGNRASGLMADKWRRAWSINRSSSFMCSHISPSVYILFHRRFYLSGELLFDEGSTVLAMQEWQWRGISSSLTGQFLYDKTSPLNRATWRWKVKLWLYPCPIWLSACSTSAAIFKLDCYFLIDCLPWEWLEEIDCWAGCCVMDQFIIVDTNQHGAVAYSSF